MRIQQLVHRLIQKYQTRDPFEIAKTLGYTVVFTNLSGIRGFYQYIHRCHIIYLDNSLSESDANFVCAHELGHSLLHRDINRIFLDSATLLVANRFENEANKFAVSLLFSEEDLKDLAYAPITTAANTLGISHHLAEYCLKNLQLTSNETRSI